MPTIPVGDIEIYYEWRGPPAGPALVFINGLLADCSSWDPIVPHFADRFRCLVYDCRGQGRSSKPDAPYETPQHAADLAALLGALGVSRCVVIGLSNGGAAALTLAAQHPGLVAALVAADAYADVDAALRAKLHAWLAAMESGGSPLRFDVATPWIWGNTFLNRQYERLLPFREKGASMPIGPAYNLIAGAMVHNVRSQLHDIRAPTLVVVGDEDVLTPPKLSRELADALPNARLEIMPDAGHAAPLEQPDQFGRMVRAFLDGLSLD